MNSQSDPLKIQAPHRNPIDTDSDVSRTPLASSREPLKDIFRQNGAPPPQIVWGPDLVDLIDNTLYKLASYALENMAEDGTVPASAFNNPDKLAGLSDWLVMISAKDDGLDFHYDYYGQGISQMYGRDMTGTNLSDQTSHVGTFYTSIYRAALARRQWVMTVHEPPDTVFVQCWRRLIIPLADAEGTLSRFAVVNVPENALRAGLEAVPDPTLVVDDRQILRFCNTAARNLLGLEPGHIDMQLFDAAGIALPVGVSAKSLDESGTVRTQACLIISNGIVASVSVTASATRLGNRPFLLLIVRPDT